MNSRYVICWITSVCLLVAITKVAAQSNVCREFNALNTNIRDRLISKANGREQLTSLLPLVKKYYDEHSTASFPADTWIFPLSGYNATAIGGKNGNGYLASGYDYFDGNRHGGHPAHDIFIRDKNQDCLDDKTGKPVNVLSMTAGVVVAVETGWDTSSIQRGGKYIWIYEPTTNCLFYYAHNNSVLVQIADIVKPGTVIATVGRTGINAHKKRSPTHLHFMQLQLDKSSYPKPVNCYDRLTKVKSD